jgi:diadenosine tetraphosphate (Ap4A) HIT family hydrolase
MDTTTSPFAARLPIGERLPVPEMVEWDIFPFDGELAVRPLDAPQLPEPPRDGESGPESCSICATPDDNYIWLDRHWRLRATRQPSGVPVVVLLEPREHYTSLDLPPERAAELGPTLQRVERAIMGLGDIARVHVNRWGDGGAHLHWWLFARPAGLLQLRGACLPLWNDILPSVPDDEWRATLTALADALTDS